MYLDLVYDFAHVYVGGLWRSKQIVGCENTLEHIPRYCDLDCGSWSRSSISGLFSSVQT